MSNDYFSDIADIVDFNRARASNINNLEAGVDAAFDKLPSLATLKRVVQDAVTAGGTANALTVTTNYTISSYVTGQRIAFKASLANTGPATVNVDGVGAKALIRQGGAALASGDIVAGRIYDAVYDGTSFQVIGTVSGEVATAVAAAATSASASAVSASLASASQSAAAASATEAQTAETNAETAKVAAEAARDAAEAAQLPSQTGHAGKILTTDGTSAAWAEPSYRWQQLGSEITTTGAGPWDFSSIGALANGYEALMLTVDITLGSGTGVQPTVRSQGTSGGVSGTNFGSITYASGDRMRGGIMLDGAARAFGVAVGGLSKFDGVRLAAAGHGDGGSFYLDGGVDLLGFGISTGTASAVSIKLWRRI